MTTSEFILQHRLSNPRDLALQARRYPDVDMPYALNQIQGWQTARQKLPSWAACDGVVYPPHLNMEQCSSEPTARYKQQVVRQWLTRLGAGQGGAATSMADLTGGFGVDFSFTSRCFASATYVERNAALCDVVRGNLPCLGIANAQVMCAEAEDCLATMPQQTMLFLDPARRDEHGAKTVLIADCTPDVCHLLPLLMSKARFVMLKLSPMLDWHKAIVDLQGTVREVHIVSVGGECKELLLVLAALDAAASSADMPCNGVEAGVRVCCVDIMAKADAEGEYKRSEFCYTIGDASENTPTPETLNPQLSTPNSQLSTLYKLVALLYLYVVDNTANVCRRVFLLSDEEHVAFLGYYITVQIADDSQSALRQLDDIAVRIVEHHVRVDGHVVALTLAQCLVHAVPCAEVSPTEVAAHHADIV